MTMPAHFAKASKVFPAGITALDNKRRQLGFERLLGSSDSQHQQEICVLGSRNKMFCAVQTPTARHFLCARGDRR